MWFNLRNIDISHSECLRKSEQTLRANGFSNGGIAITIPLMHTMGSMLRGLVQRVSSFIPHHCSRTEEQSCN